MSISYAQFEAGGTKIQHGKNDGQVLVLGFMVSNVAERVERLYAVHSDGRVRCTRWIAKPNNDFNKAGREWFDVGGPVPAEAEFIGNYVADMFPRAAR